MESGRCYDAVTQPFQRSRQPISLPRWGRSLSKLYDQAASVASCLGTNWRVCASMMARSSSFPGQSGTALNGAVDQFLKMLFCTLDAELRGQRWDEGARILSDGLAESASSQKDIPQVIGNLVWLHRSSRRGSPIARDRRRKPVLLPKLRQTKRAPVLAC